MHPRRFLVLSMPGIVVLAAAGVPLRGAAAKVSKLDVHYQDKPKDGKRCATCRQFTPAASGTRTCSLVEGDVSAEGRCLVYAPRNAG